MDMVRLVGYSLRSVRFSDSDRRLFSDPKQTLPRRLNQFRF